jgi:hypothetical protein
LAAGFAFVAGEADRAGVFAVGLATVLADLVAGADREFDAVAFTAGLGVAFVLTAALAGVFLAGAFTLAADFALARG